ncbi:hypothetical protein HYW68_01920, partial [Candidatus Parcubacteria bacterium]|nr:hypothetical protein [Candidatus Parcubacteria bacterium]
MAIATQENPTRAPTLGERSRAEALLERKRAAGTRAASPQKREPTIELGEFFLMLFFAAFFDLVSLIPWLNLASAFLGNLTFSAWFRRKGFSFKKFRLAFASEIKGILPVCSAPPALNEEALHHFLSLNYTPAPLTLFRGILQLPPGHHLTCRRDGTTQLTSYWDLQPRAATSADPAAHLAELLSDAVRLRLVSDVEVGAFLSGGLDSSAVVAWMQRHVPQRVKTFTATFREPSYDEGAYARQVAAALGTEHDEQVVEDGDLDLLPQLVWHSEELTADSSMLALYRLAQRARQKVKVVLTGDGADELFGGYSTYLATRVAQAYRWVPRPVREWVVRPLVNALPPSTSKASVESQLRRFVNGDI